MAGWIRSRVWFAAVMILLLVLAYPSARRFTLQVEVTPPQRGYDVAVRAGCFTCHGPDGIGGVKNPGSEDGEVPGFIEGTIMMWVKNDEEIREYIVDGAPARKRADPRYRQQMESQLLAMPAYGGYLSSAEIEDLMAYLRAVSGLIVAPDEVAAQGQDLAYRLGCFHCHGPMGAGGGSNPGSFKGYVPGWWGGDFDDLVRSDEELREWILDGSIARLRDHWLARYFISWQRVYMPAYRNFITEEELTALMRYVRWVRAGDWRDQPLDLAH
jgi:mono/diheme cytochrome c family protein